MAAGVTGTAQINQAVRRFLAESRYTLQERPGVVKSSITRERLPEGQGPSVNIPKYGTVSTYALTEGVDMAQAQQITDTMMTITPAEFGAQVVVSDLNLMQAKDSLLRVFGKILAESFDRQQDQTLCDDFDSFSVALGADGTVLTVGHLMAAGAQLRGQRAADGTAGRGGEMAPGPYVAVITSSHNHSLQKTLVGHVAGAVVQASGGTASMGEAPNMGNTGSANRVEFTIPGLGMQVKIDDNINKATDDTAKGAVFSPQATILVEHGAGPDVEKERDASLRAWELNFVGRWARGEYNDGWGREMLFESARPTS